MTVSFDASSQVDSENAAPSTRRSLTGGLSERYSLIQKRSSRLSSSVSKASSGPNMGRRMTVKAFLRSDVFAEKLQSGQQQLAAKLVGPARAT